MLRGMLAALAALVVFTAALPAGEAPPKELIGTWT